MTIEERARKLQWTFYHGTGGDESELQFIARLLRGLIEEEREACAKVIDAKIEDWKRCMRTMKHFTGTYEEVDLMEDMAVAIRARSDAKPG